MISRPLALVPALLGAAAMTLGCHDSLTPDHSAAKPSFQTNSGGCFGVTSASRIDKSEAQTGPSGGSKNPPNSSDYATFGFDAHPISCGTIDAAGQISWVEHNRSAVLGGFSFDGVVTAFIGVADHFGDTGNPNNGCGAFAGSGTVDGRNGSTFTGVTFVVEHACDRGEPGTRRDHIQFCLGTGDPAACNAGNAPYRRNGVLTGGNIQKYSL
jgi:hypothetical protein